MPKFKKVYFWSVFFLWFSCFCVFVFLWCKKGLKRLFSCNFGVFIFSILFRKRPVLKSFFSSYAVFIFCFPFVFPFKIPFFLCFLSTNPFLEHIIFGGFFCFFFLPFPFLLFDWLFETNFLTSPF